MASAPVAIRGNYSHLYGSAALPVLEEMFRSNLAQWPNVLHSSKIFRVVSTDRDIWQASALHDLPLFSEVAEGAEYNFERSKQGASRTLSIVKYGLGTSISDEAMSDGKFDLFGLMIEKLARSAVESQEVQAAGIFNNGFGSTVGSDGLALFHASHTLPSGGTFRNKPSTPSDLDVTSLDAALTDFYTQFVGDSGIIMRIQPKILLVHESNRRNAMELVGSDLKPDTADNNMNSLKGEGLQVVASPHLSDTDAWFLLADPMDTGLRIVKRTGIETKAAGPDVGFMTDSMFYKSRYREIIGVTEAYGAYGNAGA